MKKLIALILVLTMTVTLIGCENKKNYETALSNEPNSQGTESTGKLVAVNKSDESKFTAKEWKEILLKVENGDILFFDTREEEFEYFSHK